MGSIDVTTSSYSWTESGSLRNEYYLRTSGGGNPGLTQPEVDLVFIDDVSCGVAGTLGALADHGWGWGDNDTLGYSTLYVRDISGNPDSTSVVIEVAQISTMYLATKSYVTIDGLTFKYAAQTNDYIGGFLAQGGDHIIVQNCEAHWCNGNGICIKGDYSTIDACTVSYCGAHNIAAGGYVGDHLQYPTIKNCVSHHARTTGYSGENPYDGYGLKFLFVDYGLMYGNEVYSCEMQGINLDGSAGDAEGTTYCEVYENKVYDNAFQGILVEIYSTNNKVYRNLVYNNGNDNDDALGHYQIGLTHRCTNNEIYCNVVYRTSGAWPLIGINEYTSGGGCSGTKLYNNTMDGGGVANYCIYVDGYTSPENMVIKNNILYGTTSTPCYIQGTSFTGLTSDYNCFRRSDSGTSIFNRNYTGYTVATHCSTYSQDCHSINDDPDFVNASSHNYTLQGGSPCINAGTDLGSSYDDALMPSSTWPSGVVTGDQDDY